MKKTILLRSLTGIITVLIITLFLVSCDQEQEVVYVDEPVYVQDDSGKWIEYAIFMNLMNQQHRTIDVNHYHYSTRSTNGSYKSYKPTPQQFTQMKEKKFTGKFKSSQMSKKSSRGNYKFSSTKKSSSFSSSGAKKSKSSFSTTPSKKKTSSGGSSSSSKKSSNFKSSSKKR